MNEKNRKDLLNLKIALNRASDLRIFPNGRDLNSFESVSLNQLGKMLECISGVLEEIFQGKKPRKQIDIIRNARLELEQS